MDKNKGKNKKKTSMQEAWDKALDYFEDAQEHYRGGEYEKVIEYCDNAINQYPVAKEGKPEDLSYVYFLMGEALHKLKKHDAALDNFEQCLRLTSEIPEEVWGRADVDREREPQPPGFSYMLDMSLWDLQRKTWLSKAEAYEELGKEKEEEEAFSMVLQFDSRNLYFLKESDRAIVALDYYNSAMYWSSKISGISDIFWELVGRLSYLKGIGKSSEKERWWGSPLGKKYNSRAKKYFYRALYNEGICLYELGHREKAALYLDRVREISPEKALKDQVKKLADRLGLELPELKPDIYPGDERYPEEEVYPPKEEISLGDINSMEIRTKIDRGIWRTPGTCPVCGSTHIVTDDKRGERVCDDCGMVIEEKILDTSATIRVSEEGKKKKVKPSVRREMSRIKRVGKWQKTSRERTMAKWGIEVDRLISMMGMPKTIKKGVDELYEKAVRGKLTNGRSTTLTVAALVYCVCREQGYPRTFKEIVEGAGLAEKLGVKPTVAKNKLASTSKSLSKKLHLMLKVQDPQSYISRFCSNLKLDINVQTKANEILKQATDKGLSGGRPPLAAATAIYIASIVCNERRTQKQVAGVAGVTDDAVIRKRYKIWVEELGLKMNVKSKKR